MTTLLADDGVELRRILFTEFQAAADDVRRAAGSVTESLASTVHDYRKALRRARAVLKLFAPALPRRDARDIRRALTQARRTLGATRDHAVANDVLGTLDGEQERALAKTVLDNAAASALASAEIKQLLAEGAARTAAQVEMLDAALPQRIAWHTAVEGLRATYAEARDARKAAKRSRHAFHIWRRRCKELVIQLDVLARISPDLDIQRERVEAVSDTLGHAVDLLMARDFVRTHAADIGEDGVDLLSDAICRELDDEIRKGRRAGRDAFRKKPRTLARKLAKTLQRDVTTVAAPPPIRAEEFATT
jgi:CHAD domain-containing protein